MYTGILEQLSNIKTPITKRIKSPSGEIKTLVIKDLKSDPEWYENEKAMRTKFEDSCDLDGCDGMLAYIASKLPDGRTMFVPAGYLIINLKNNMLDELFIYEKFRRHGIAEILIKTAIKDFGVVGTLVLKNNHQAIKLYKKCGLTKQTSYNESLYILRK